MNVTVFMRDEPPDTVVTLAIALLIAIYCAWRRDMRGKASAFRVLAPWQFFLCVAAFFSVTLLNVPEGWVCFSSETTIQSEVMFRLTYPGPSLGRKRQCDAGMRFDDA